MDPTVSIPAHLLPSVRQKLDRLKELRKNAAIQFFQPHEKQCLFFLGAHRYFRYARTGNRFGKSEMGACEDIAFALGYRPWIPEGTTGRSLGMTEDGWLYGVLWPLALLDTDLRTLGIPPHPTKGLIITTDWDKSTEVFTEMEGENLGKLFKYIPKAALGTPTRNHSGAIDRIPVRHRSGGWSVIHLDTVKSYKQNPLGQESSVWDWVHIDEPIPEGMWKAVSRGLVDRGGRAWFTCTPLTEPWIDQKFVPDAEDQVKADLGVVDSEESATFMMTGSMDDNPHNDAAAIARFMQDLTDDEKEARRHGKPMAYTGLVYKEFDWNTHVARTPPAGWSGWTPPPDHCIYIANDYHFKKNNATMFIAVPPDGPAVIFHELWEKFLVDDEVAAIRNVLCGRPYQPIIMDPLASTPNKITDLTAMDEYRMRGLAVLPATKDPVNGIRAVRALFKARAKDGKTPLILIAAHCKRTLFEIGRGFTWDPEHDKPIKENDDMCECLYRLVLQGLTYVEPAQDHEYTPIPARDLPANVLDWNFGERSEPKKIDRSQRYRGGTERVIYEDEAIL